MYPSTPPCSLPNIMPILTTLTSLTPNALSILAYSLIAIYRYIETLVTYSSKYISTPNDLSKIPSHSLLLSLQHHLLYSPTLTTAIIYYLTYQTTKLTDFKQPRTVFSKHSQSNTEYFLRTSCPYIMRIFTANLKIWQIMYTLFRSALSHYAQHTPTRSSYRINISSTPQIIVLEAF